MVSLDAKTGKVNWERRLKNEPGITTYTMSGSDKYNVVVSSAKKNYYIYAYSTKNGDLVWSQKQSWFSGDHGGHLSRPAIVGNKLIVKPAIYKLDSGEKFKMEIPKAGHGCATYALTEQSAFYRGGSVTQFNFDTEKFSKWERLRPDCWLSTIPAQGMVLSPEAGGGCSCGNWLETSMVFSPISRAPISFLFKNKNFIDSLTVKIKSRDITNKKIYYTVDGSEVTMDSKQYSGPILITKNTTLNAAIYLKKNNGLVAFKRTKIFKRERPEPVIVELPQLIDKQWKFSIERVGQTGEVHYTTDGAIPTIKSPKYTEPVKFVAKTLVKAKTFWKTSKKTFESKETSFELVIPVLAASVTTNVKSGVLRGFYKGKGKKKKLPNLSEMKALKTAVVKVIDSTSFVGGKMYAQRFSGYIKIPQDGMYTFSNKVKQTISFVSLDNAIQLENKNGDEKSKTLPLKKGLHPITIDCFVGKGIPNINLQMEGPNMTKGKIPASLLFY